MKNEELRLTIDQLSNETGFSTRKLRWLIGKGRLKPPMGKARGSYYGEDHLKALRKIRMVGDLGVRPSDEWRRYVLKPGLELHVTKAFEEKKGISIMLKVLSDMASD